MATTGTDLTTTRYRAIRREAVARIAETVVRDPPKDRDAPMDFVPYVREWIEDEYDEVLGRFDPSSVESAVPRDLDDVESAAGTPRVDEETDERRRELYATHAVRADVLATLSGDEDYLRRAIAVHDALERLVGEREGRTDRRPSGVVESFAEWVARERDEATAERATTAFTPLHVMRIAGLSVVEAAPEDRGLLRALEAWLQSEHRDVFAAPADDAGDG